MLFVAHFTILFRFKAKKRFFKLFFEFNNFHNASVHYGEISPRQQPITARDFTGSNLCHIIKICNVNDVASVILTSLNVPKYKPLFKYPLPIFQDIVNIVLSLFSQQTKKTIYTVENLLAKTKYKFRVAAVTLYETSSFSNWSHVFHTNCKCYCAFPVAFNYTRLHRLLKSNWFLRLVTWTGKVKIGHNPHLFWSANDPLSWHGHNESHDDLRVNLYISFQIYMASKVNDELHRDKN